MQPPTDKQIERLRFVASNPWLCSECGPVEADQVDRENYAAVHYSDDDDEQHLVTHEGELAEDVAALLAYTEHQSEEAKACRDAMVKARRQRDDYGEAQVLEQALRLEAESRVEQLEEALGRAADDLDKAANQFASFHESQQHGHTPEVRENHHIFAAKAQSARAALANQPTSEGSEVVASEKGER